MHLPAQQPACCCCVHTVAEINHTLLLHSNSLLVAEFIITSGGAGSSSFLKILLASIWILPLPVVCSTWLSWVLVTKYTNYSWRLFSSAYLVLQVKLEYISIKQQYSTSKYQWVLIWLRHWWVDARAVLFQKQRTALACLRSHLASHWATKRLI